MPGELSLDPYTPSSGSRIYRVAHYDLHLDYHTLPNRLVGRATLSIEVLEAAEALRLDLEGLKVSKVQVGGKNARFRQTAHHVTVRPAGGVKPGQRLTMTVRYAGNPAPANGTWGDVGWEELEEGVLVAGQPNGAATWFPCNDHPSQKATFDFTILSDSDYAVIANGELTATRRKASRTEWVWRQREPMTTYLATIQIGPYQRGALQPGPHTPARVPMVLAAGPHHWEKAQKVLSKQHAMMNAFEEMFGPYPFGHYGVVVNQ